MKSTEILLKLKGIFEPFIKVQNEDLLSLTQAGEILTFEKNTILKKHNCKEEFLRFILDGIGCYLVNHKNTPTCIYFEFENGFFVDYTSFAFEKPSDLILKTMTKATMFVISKKAYSEICQSNINIFKIEHIGLELLHQDTFKKYIELLTLDATERYKILIKTRQDIMQHIDHKYIASYLGITPQSLSRLRKNLKL